MPPLGHDAAAWRRLLEDPALAAQRFPGLGAACTPRTRRHVLKLMAASLLLAGCDPAEPDGRLIPRPVAAPGIIPGRPDYYSTASVSGGYAIGVLVEHEMGRPLKVEGNPLHPDSLGATDALAQASILDFYDPDRAGSVLAGGEPAGHDALLAALAEARARLSARRGAGFRIVTGPFTSPTEARALDALLAAYPEARWTACDPLARYATARATEIAYGAPLDLVPNLAPADVIVAIDSDLLSAAPGHVRHARHFAARRNPTAGPMNRLYALEGTPGIEGAVADHRFAVEAAELPRLAAALADAVTGDQTGTQMGVTIGGAVPPWIGAIAADLRAHHGRALIHAGPFLPAELHARLFAANEALGARGNTLSLVPTALYTPAAAQDMAALIEEMQAGRVDTLLILSANPAYSEPHFRDALARVRFSLAAAPLLDETGAAARWFVPLAHAFETWGDARGHDGTACILQPQSLPLWGGMAALALIGLFAGAAAVDPHVEVRATWAGLRHDDEAWREALASGVIAGSALAPSKAPLRPAAAAPASAPTPGLSLLLRPDPHLGDGSRANNAWLQELPRPLTKLVWDNPLHISPALARRMDLHNGDEVELGRGEAQLRLPVWIVPGQPENTLTGLLGFGRTVCGEVGRGAGWDLHPLQAMTGELCLRKTGRTVAVACTDHRDPMQGDAATYVRHGTLAAFQQRPDFLRGTGHGEMLYERRPGGDVAWGMSIDLNACIGCNACVVACMAENNVPVVGKENVIREREMHWLRIDRYYEGSPAAPEVFFQPLLCMHCEQAPCEVVCPFGATVHDEEGLNVMVYNRCAGTRFCSNNCPYKVRRFNYGAYASDEHRPAESRNPAVDARARGVMEKCSFCIQRIAQARIAHDRDGVPERAETACQAACPTRAFTFGNLNDPAETVVQRKHSPLSYVLLPESNTRPRVTYEGLVRNPNPDLTA